MPQNHAHKNKPSLLIKCDFLPMWCDWGVSDRRQIDILLKMQKMHFFFFSPLSPPSMKMRKKKSSYLMYKISVTVIYFSFFCFKCVDLLAWLSVACAVNSSCWCFFAWCFLNASVSVDQWNRFFSSVCVVVVVDRLLE